MGVGMMDLPHADLKNHGRALTNRLVFRGIYLSIHIYIYIYIYIYIFVCMYILHLHEAAR